MMHSLWMDTADMPTFAPLEGDGKTDVLIVGGGLAGLLAAYMLHQSDVDCMLIEANRLMSGTSGRTTAKLTSQHGLFAERLVRQFGVERARMYMEANERALAQYRRMCADIPCDFEERDAYVYARMPDGKLERELHALHRIGADAAYCSGLPLPFPVAGAIRFAKQAQFHPMKFAAALANGLKIHEQTAAQEFIGTTVITNHGRIRAQKVVMATHFPLINKHGSYFLKMYQSRSYVLALEHAADVNGMYRDAQEDGLSFRNHGQLLLLGGGAHRTGKKSEAWEGLVRQARVYYPDSKEAYRWAAQDCMPLDGVPYIGRYSAGTQDLYVATGFGKWGMTASMVAAMMLRDMVQGKRSEYEPIFSPSRSMLHPQLAVNALEAAISLITPTAPRCPHMGCALKWNAQEHSWDCPCHGSRFAEDGMLLNTPATGELKSLKA